MIDRQVADSLPRKNGELVFDAPWEGRAFGMAVIMHDKGAYQWNDFRDRLIEELGDGATPYYEGWLSAFQSVLLAQRIIERSEIDARAEDFRELRRDPVF